MSSFCKSYSHFFSKNISIYAIFHDQSFNNTSTNNSISFEQLSPLFCLIRSFDESMFVLFFVCLFFVFFVFCLFVFFFLGGGEVWGFLFFVGFFFWGGGWGLLLLFFCTKIYKVGIH